MGRTVIEALGIGTSATHMEWFFGPEGPQVLRDRLPSAGRARVGPLRRGQRHRHLPRVGDGDRRTAARRSSRRAASLGRDHRAAARPRRPHRRLRRARRDPGALRRVDHRRPPAACRARRRSRSRPATWPTRGSACKHPDYDTLRGMLDDVGRTVKVHARRERAGAAPRHRPPARRPSHADVVGPPHRARARFPSSSPTPARSSTAATPTRSACQHWGVGLPLDLELRPGCPAPTSGTWCSSSRRARASSTSSRSPSTAGAPHHRGSAQPAPGPQPVRRQLGVPGRRLRDAHVGRARPDAPRRHAQGPRAGQRGARSAPRTTTLYLPPGFDAAPAVRYPLLVVHDGGDYLHYAAAEDRARQPDPSAPRAAAGGRVQPPGERLVEYADDPRHARFLTEELVAGLEAELPLAAAAAGRCLMGASFGAVAVARRPPTATRSFYGRLLLQSGSFAWSSNGCSQRRGPIWQPVKAVRRPLRRGHPSRSPSGCS